MICSFARKSRHPPQTGVPPSVRRVWPEFPSDSETWIEFRRNYSLRLKPEPARHPCAASPPQQVQIFSNYWGAGNIFKYWAIIEKLVVILSILQISGSRLIRILAAGCVPIPISVAPPFLFICIWWNIARIANAVQVIPNICHFFYTGKFFGEKNLHRKTPIFRVKSVKKNPLFRVKSVENANFSR